MAVDWLGISIFHHLGIIGSFLMLSGVIYSFKKRWDKPWGSTPFWLKHHEVVSVLGATLVLIHSNGSFNGLAGISILMMIIIIISGFIGHYIYTRIPRNTLGKEKARAELELELEALRKDLGKNYKARSDEGDIIFSQAKLENKIKKLNGQIKNLERARHLLSGWRAVHIPMTILFLITVIIHIISSLYYGNYLG